ncbi:MAG TPA: ATPase, T2SS/T4P/T4SS family, partial [Vicinamibacterales bacterium]|nr:ATPase, T2SS/T4P/T4SS family [Vicinamibacterales bacterium]
GRTRGHVRLLDSLLDAIVRLEGDALVMHVGEKPYVVTTSATMNAYRGPLAWGQVELSSRVLTPDAVLAMVSQVLPAEQRQILDQVGALEHEIPPPPGVHDRFTVVAARGGDDIWLEVRRHAVEPSEEAIAAEVSQKPVAAAETSVAASGAGSSSTAVGVLQEPPLPAPEPIRSTASEQQRGEDATPAPIQERMPVASEASHEPADHEALVHIDVPGPEGVLEAFEDVEELEELELEELEEEVEDQLLGELGSGTIELLEDEAQMTPTEDDVDVLLAATAALLSSSAGAKEEVEEVAGEEEPGHEEPHESTEWFAPVSQSAVEAQSPEQDEPEDDAVREATGLEAGEPLPFDAMQMEDFPASAAAALVAPLVEAPPIASDEPEPLTETTGPIRGSVGAGGELPGAQHEAARAAASVPHLDWRQPVSETIPDTSSRLNAQGHAFQPQTTSESAGRAATEARSAPEQHRPDAPLSGIRAEAPAAAATPPAAQLQHLLRTAAARGASTVYLIAQARPMARMDGEFAVLEGERALTAPEIQGIIRSLAPAEATMAAGSAAGEWVSDVAGVGRVRCVAFHDHRGPGAIFRMIPTRMVSADQLGLPPEIRDLCAQTDGLVIIAGPRASGKSTLLTGVVDLINRTRSDHVITIERQIGFIHESRRSFVSQREVPAEGEELAAAVRAALHEDPDVLVIEELQSGAVVRVALEAAQAGRLVVATVQAPSTVAAIEQLVALVPAEERARAQASLAAGLRAVVAQVLLRRAAGGRTAAREVLLNTPAVSALIVEGRMAEMLAALDSGRAQGMVPLADSLASLVRDGAVHVTEAYRKASDRAALRALLQRDHIDTSFAEKLA